MATRVQVTGDLPQDKIESAELLVVMKDGREFSASCEVAKGHPRDPMSKAEIERKYRQNCRFSGQISEESAEKALELINKLESLDDVGELVAQLVGES
jgi:2-methylcitrate dehydratase PrpD